MKRQRKQPIVSIALYGLLVLVLGALAYSLAGAFFPPTEEKAAVPAVFATITTGDTSQGNVEIVLTPGGIVNGKLEVALAANTHSVDLGAFDLKKITTLTSDSQTLTPASAPALTGHHNSGTIVFDGIAAQQAPFTITIRGIPAVEERTYSWN